MIKVFLCSFLAILICSCSGRNAEQQNRKDSIDVHTLSIQDTVLTDESNTGSNCVRVVDPYDRPPGSITDLLYSQLDSAEVYDNNVLYGYWFKPHEACAVNIIFNKDKTFVMRDYDPDDEECTVYERVGTFKVKGDSVHLSSEDGWRLSLRHWKVWDDGIGKYLTLDKGKKDFRYYLVKGSN